MHILITGGTGFIGTELRKHFLKKGYYLTIVTRSPERYESESARNQSFISWGDDLTAAMEETDVVINLVGENIFGKRWTDQVKKRLYASRVELTRRLVEAVKNATNRPDLFISASGVNYYGDRGDELLTEDEPAGEGFLARLCVDWEAAAEPVREADVRLVIFRNAAVLDTGGGPIQYMLPVFKLGIGGPVGDGEQFFSWIHMLDVIRATDFVIDHKEVSGALNLTSPNPVKMNELARTMGDVLNRPSFFRVPEFIVKLVLGQASEPLLDSLRTQPRHLLSAGFEFRFKHLDEALSEIV